MTYKRIILCVLILAADYVLLYYGQPLFSVGSTLVEAGAVVASVLLVLGNFKLFKKILTS